MIIKCLYSTGKSLRQYEYQPLEENILGRFGATGYTEYGGLEIGKEYLVMGIIIFETYQSYLIDDNGMISAFPCHLFEIVDSRVNSKWHYRLIENDEDIYPFIQCVFGYPELCSDKRAYESLIVEMEESARLVYFNRKLELEKELEK